MSNKEELFKIARSSILNPDFKTSEFKEKKGVFVTIYTKGNLRGCIGFIEPKMELGDAIVRAARLAAYHDGRFMPLQKGEDFKLEISVLNEPKLIKVKDSKEYFTKIKIPGDGLIIKGIFNSGLLLPQVFEEYKCDVKKALEMTCQKAGLGINDWKDLSNKIYVFNASLSHLRVTDSKSNAGDANPIYSSF